MRERMNPYEALARHRKVEKLVDFLRASDFTLEQVHAMQADHWQTVARAAGVGRASEITIAAVIAKMEGKAVAA